MLGSGAVCCPSFHVIWAILSAQALSSFRWLKPVVWPYAALVLISTVTTGWHYVVDVFAGVLISAVAVWAARQVLSRPQS
jgi:membrane-associated phospholipid phosphatase